MVDACPLRKVTHYGLFGITDARADVQEKMSRTGAKGLLPEQCRAARGFLNWTQDCLAERAGVSRSTVRGFEGQRHVLHRTTEEQLVRVLEDAGICFLSAGKFGPGVRLRRSRPEVAKPEQPV